MNNMSHHSKTPRSDKSAMDIVTVGERGQVVIPAAIREQIGLRAGAKLMVFTKHSEVICLLPTDSMRQLVNILTEQLSDIESDDSVKQEII